MKRPTKTFSAMRVCLKSKQVCAVEHTVQTAHVYWGTRAYPRASPAPRTPRTQPAKRERAREPAIAPVCLRLPCPEGRWWCASLFH